MNLTYKVTENGYTIFNDGEAWIVQDSFIPFKAETLIKSAELHIEAILSDEEISIGESEKIKQLEAQIKQQEQAIAELSAIMSINMM